MTIQQLLRHHGFNCARRVLPSGRLTFDVPTASGSPLGLAVTTHTFHGGSESIDDVEKAPWWLAPNALERDRAAMAEYFPTFSEVARDADRPPAWFGSIDTKFGGFNVGIVHRFDHGLPAVIPINPEARGRRRGRQYIRAPHTYTNGNLCIAATDDWEPARDTVATVVAWTAHWHAFYVEWLFTGKWPAEMYVAEVG